VGYVSPADYERILAIVAESASGTMDEPLGGRTLDMIRLLISCDVVALMDGRPWDRAGRRVFAVGSTQPGTTEESRITDRYRFQIPLGPSPATINRPVRISDVMSRSRYRRTDLYQLVGRRRGVEFGMDYWFAGRAGRISGLTFDSRQHDFSDRDRDLVEVLGRHLATVVGRLDAQLPATAASRTLTARQAEVFALVSEGQTNAQIAHALSISPLTVKKHVENVFGLMGVHSRAAAIASLHDRPRRVPAESVPVGPSVVASDSTL
jgi:DNA-binding CsgD family transcriptional regulator